VKRAIALAAATLICLALLGARTASAKQAATDTCVACHEQEEDEDVAKAVPEWRKSVHFAAEVTCDGCHGGNPRAKDEDDAHAESAGWVGTPGWKELPTFCGACHESIAHGFADGNLGARFEGGGIPPTCVDCHMSTGHDTPHANAKEILADPLPERLRALPQLAQARRDVLALAQRETLVSKRVAAVSARALPPTGLARELRTLHDGWAPHFHRFEPAAFAKADVETRAALDTVETRAAQLEREAYVRARLGEAGLATLTVAFAVLAGLRSRRDP
jgi:nitrate/TMAO reductase-like tetraheme cytochrome c subunit